MYNPSRNKPKTNQRRKNPHDVHKRSNRQTAIGTNVSPTVVKEKTEKGYAGHLFQGKDFEVSYQLVLAGNSWDFGYNDKKDRMIQVMSGIVFVTVETDGERTFEKLQKGAHYKMPRGMKYSLSTATDDAELLVVESPNYTKGWTTLSAGISADRAGVAFTSAMTREAMAPVAEPAARNRQPNPIASRQRQRPSRNATPAGKAGQQAPGATAAFGVNLAPIIPTGE